MGKDGERKAEGKGKDNERMEMEQKGEEGQGRKC